MDTERRPSALQNILKLLGISHASDPVDGRDHVHGDEPLEYVPELKSKDDTYTKAAMQPCQRRESLLTRAITARSGRAEHQLPRALSTCSTQSMPSTAELTSDGDLTSSARSASPSPPVPTAPIAQMVPPIQSPVSGQVVIAPVTNDDRPAVVDVGEAAVEKSLGRKRCIMFACADKQPEQAPKELPPPARPASQPEAQPRKCRLTFLCPTRQDSNESQHGRSTTARQPSPMPPVSREQSGESPSKPAVSSGRPVAPVARPPPSNLVSPPTFHEFGNSQDETDAWVDQPSPARPKLTLDDVMKKENDIRRLAVEADEEAEAEEEAEDSKFTDLGGDDEEAQDEPDDFAPSDDDEGEESDGGNESDDEGGFAESDDESDDGSEYRFWAPSTTTAATSVDNVTHISTRQRSRTSSVDSTPSQRGRQHPMFMPRKVAKPIAVRAPTPELPDSTDFVCGTLDEDRPLEAAYVACREQRKLEKHVPIPQDIDPSFPTSDPEDHDDDDDDDDDGRLATESSVSVWMNNQFTGFEDDGRGRRPSAIRLSPPPQKTVDRSELGRAQPSARKLGRSPPPPPRHRSPAPRKLFGHSPSRRRSPVSRSGRLRSPRGSPVNMKLPLGITINRLAQRPATHRTASLPHTPNPFFRNWEQGSPATSTIPSAAITPGIDTDEPRPDLHVRGPVDIVIGLEKKRQKRKDKFWRLHCRKAAKEQAERRPVPGRGVERMKELGLECAERTRGYGLGQQAQLIISL